MQNPFWPMVSPCQGSFAVKHSIVYDNLILSFVCYTKYFHHAQFVEEWLWINMVNKEFNSLILFLTLYTNLIFLMELETNHDLKKNWKEESLPWRINKSRIQKELNSQCPLNMRWVITMVIHFIFVPKWEKEVMHWVISMIIMMKYDIQIFESLYTMIFIKFETLTI